jgi:hypothetical protein
MQSKRRSRPKVTHPLKPRGKITYWLGFYIIGGANGPNDPWFSSRKDAQDYLDSFPEDVCVVCGRDIKYPDNDPQFCGDVCRQFYRNPNA